MTTSHKTKWREARMKIQTDYCLWVLVDGYDRDTSSQWASQCGQEWSFSEGTPEIHGYKFCPNCGKPVKQEQS